MLSIFIQSDLANDPGSFSVRIFPCNPVRLIRVAEIVENLEFGKKKKKTLYPRDIPYYTPQ